MATTTTRVNKESSRLNNISLMSSVTSVIVEETKGKAIPPPVDQHPLASS